MIDTFYIGCYWNARAQTLNDVVQKTLRTFEGLNNVDEQFVKWYMQGESKKKALEKEMVFDKENVEKLCLEYVRKGELDEKGFATMGFIYSLWTGHRKEEESSSISFKVGCDNKWTNSNCCLVRIPYEKAIQERILKIEKVKKIIAMLVEIWQPDYAVLMSGFLRDALGLQNDVGWVTYRKIVNGSIPIIANVTHERLNKGHLFYLNLASDNTFDYGLIDDLRPLAQVVN